MEIATQAATALENAKLYEEVNQLNSRKDQFIGFASHELKTPITTLKGYLQIIAKVSEREHYKEVNTFLPKTSKQIDKLTGLVNDLLNVSKIQAGKLDFHLSDFELAEIIEDALADLRHWRRTMFRVAEFKKLNIRGIS